MPFKTLVLLLLSLALLWVGNFIQFDDTSGFGSDDWLMPYAGLALLAAVASILLSLSDLRARRSLGVALLVLDGLIVIQAWTNPGFRFIWSGDEGETFMFEVALLLCGLALMTRSVYRPAVHPAPVMSAPEEAQVAGDLEMTGWARFVAYLAAGTVLTFFAFFVGVAQFEATECGDSSGGECDLSILGGFIWAAGAVVLSVIATIATEASRVFRNGNTRA